MIKADYDTGKKTGERPILQIDSSVEEIFYNKCVSNRQWVTLLLEWENSKKIYVNYTNLIAGMYGNYSRHDSSHSIAILEAITAVIGKERMESLSVMDLWLLLHCAYAHDMGMPYTYDESLELWKSASKNSDFKTFLDDCATSEDEDMVKAVEYIRKIAAKIDSTKSDKENNEVLVKEFSYEWVAKVNRYCSYLTAAYCRKDHAKRTKDIIKENIKQRNHTSSFVIEDRFYGFVALCSEAHGKEFKDVLKISRKEYAHTCYCHPAFIAALLRLGDLLDIDNNRFDVVQLKYYGKIEELSRIHKEKHESITHINYEPDKIEIKSESDELEVCRCANDWFFWLEDEVKNLILHWAEIAPKCLNGCTLSVPKTEVYYKGKLFSDAESHQFVINKNLLIDLVIGRNLYKSALDFIREYIQNSFDALKMKFWMEMNDDADFFLIHEEYISEWKNKGVKSVNPFYFKKEAFDRLRIEIECDKKIDKDKNLFIKISISDRGIGIDKECIQSISNIGSSWDKRKNYREQLEMMPEWLKPTGGFGIGIQSGFMVSDKVVIKTKCEKEQEGRRITLHSSAKSGKIEVREEGKAHHGTSISVEIPYSWFLDENNYHVYDLYKDIQVNDYFSADEILEAVNRILFEYVINIAQNSIFPIYVYRKGFKPEVIQNELPYGKQPYYYVGENGTNYGIYEKDKHEVFIWREEQAVLCKIDTSVDMEKAELRWFYKGVRLWPDIPKRFEYIAKCFGDISIDVMGYDVKECLTVDRNKFLKTFDAGGLLQQLLRAFVNSKDSLKKMFTIDFTDVDIEYSKLKKEDFYRAILAHSYMIDEKKALTISNVLGGIEEDDIRFLNNSSLFIDNLKYDAEKSRFALERMLIPYFCRLYLHEKENLKTAFFNSGVKLSEINGGITLVDNNIENLIDDKILYAIVTTTEYTDVIDLKSLALEFLTIRKEEELKDENEEDVFANALNSMKPQMVFKTTKYYEKLWVTTVPFEKDVIPHKNEKEKAHMIISPIRATQSDKDVLRSKYRGQENAKEQFKKSIMEDSSFTYLVDWVYTHQVEKEKYDKEEIMKEYDSLLTYIYEQNLKD